MVIFSYIVQSRHVRRGKKQRLLTKTIFLTLERERNARRKCPDPRKEEKKEEGWDVRKVSCSTTNTGKKEEEREPGAILHVQWPGKKKREKKKGADVPEDGSFQLQGGERRVQVSIRGQLNQRKKKGKRNVVYYQKWPSKEGKRKRGAGKT